jgi:transcriptional regulator with XRE-family HTH domain
MSADHRPLRELGHFLRARRLEVDPASKGLPVGRRRTPGLRREEVAILASISPSWYTYLEQGRDIRPSEPVLNALADVLDLTQAERRYLHLLALGGAPHRDQPVTAAALESIRLLVRSLDPLPAYAGDRCGDVVASNEACGEWLVDFGALPVGERNAIIWVACDPAARERLPDWEDEARDVIGRFRATTASNDPLDPRVRQVSNRLQASEFGRVPWDEHTVSDLTFRRRRIRHPELGEQTFQMLVLLVAGADKIGVVVHIPVGALEARDRPAPVETGP